MKRAVLLACSLLVAAASARAESVEDALGRLKGRPVSEITAKLGDPDFQEQASGGTTYVWRTPYRPSNAPVPSSTPDYATGRPNNDAPGSFNSTRGQVCTFRVLVDGAGIVGGAEAAGGNAACAPVIHKLAGW